VIRVLLADDHPAFLRGLQTMLGESEEIEVVGTAGTGLAAVDAVRELRPDAVVMDLHMPELDGVEATARITAEAPGTAVLVLTMHDDDASLQAALRAGASGYLLKEAGGPDIVRALAGVVNGDAVFGRTVAPRVLRRIGTDEDRSRPPFPMLTSREVEVLDLLARGRSNGQIASALFLSAKTVRNHVSNILMKLPASDRHEAAGIARAAGLGADAARPAWQRGDLRPGATGFGGPGDAGAGAP
jgi:DNA-binding NarL/FixJ family response regulator